MAVDPILFFEIRFNSREQNQTEFPVTNNPALNPILGV
jgi:hypothetical protein